MTDKKQTESKAAPKAKSKAKSKAKPAKKMSLRQAEIQAASINRGLDNTVQQIEKEAERSIAGIRKKLKQVREISLKAKDLVSGLSNIEVAKPAKPVKKAAAKPAKKKALAKKATAKKKAPAKKAPVKKATAKKAPAKKATAKKSTPAKAEPAKKEAAKAAKKEAKPPKPPVANRPVLREAIHKILAGKKILPTELREALEEKWGYWSRQSVYTMLKKDPRVKKEDDGRVSLQEDVDAFVNKVDEDASVAQVV